MALGLRSPRSWAAFFHPLSWFSSLFFSLVCVFDMKLCFTARLLCVKIVANATVAFATKGGDVFAVQQGYCGDLPVFSPPSESVHGCVWLKKHARQVFD